MTTRNNKNNYTKNNSYPSTDYVVGINWILFVVLSVTTHFVSIIYYNLFIFNLKVFN